MIIDKKFLDALDAQAGENPRQRMNYNFHTSLDAKSQRLLNAVRRGSRFIIHRHPETSETMVVLRGHVVVKTYRDDKSILNQYDINPVEGRYGAHIEAGVWHTLEVIEDSVIFECKDGPYHPNCPENTLKI